MQILAWQISYQFYLQENCVRNTTDKRQKMEKCGWCAKNSDKITKIPNEIKKTNKLLKDQTYYYCEEKVYNHTMRYTHKL